MADPKLKDEDNIGAALDIARRMEDPAARIEAGIRGLSSNLAGLDLEANVPQFHTGLPSRPLTGGAGLIPSKPSNNPDLFDFSRLNEVPKVQQFDLPRYQPARGVPARVTEMMANPDVRNAILQTINEGVQKGGAKWYNADPLRDAFVERLGADAGDQAFRKYMDLVAATSPRSDVGTNVRNASYYYQRAMSGQPMPEVGEKNPQPYGHMAQKLHQMNAQRVAGEGWDPLQNPKPASFVENLVGNQAPVTVDTHAYRLPAILARDPRFLEISFKPEKDVPPMNIQKMVEAGKIPFEEAVNRPAYWQSQPKENEYGAMEQYYKSLGQELGLTPAQTQAAAWVGGGKITGLQSDESKPFLQFFQDRIFKTAAETGMDPKDVLDSFIRGKSALRAEGGRTMGNNAIDNAIRVARLSDDQIDMPHSLKELQDWKKTHSSHKADMDKAFSSKMSGFEGAEPIAMPADLNELLAYLRSHHASGGRAHFDDGGDASPREGDTPGYSRADYGLGPASAVSSETPSFRDVEDRSMRDYERAIGSGWSPTGGGGREMENAARDTSYDRGAEALNAQRASQDISPFSFGRRDLIYGTDFLGRAPSNLSQYTQQRLETVPENLYQAASNPSFYLGMGKPGLVGMELPSRAGLAGFLGNIAAESEFDPTAIGETGATGLAQWTGTRKAGLLQNLGIAPKTSGEQLRQALEGTQYNQLGYALNELQNDPYYASSLRQFTKATDPARAAEVFMKNFEAPSPSEQEQSLPRRASEAKGFYQRAEANLPASVAGVQYASNLRPAAMQTATDATVDTGKAEMLPPTEQDLETTAATTAKTPAELSLLERIFGSTQDQIAKLEAAKRTATYPGEDPADIKQWYADQYTGGDVSKVKSRIVDQGQGPVVDYYAKELMPELIGALMPGAGLVKLLQGLAGTKTGDQQVADAMNIARGGGGGGRDQQQTMTAPATATQAAPAPYTTELSAGNLALPSVTGQTAEQWAAANTGGDMSKVHARIKYVNGAPRLEYYTV